VKAICPPKVETMLEEGGGEGKGKGKEEEEAFR
jgi:hypothetical protein